MLSDVNYLREEDFMSGRNVQKKRLRRQRLKKRIQAAGFLILVSLFLILLSGILKQRGDGAGFGAQFGTDSRIEADDLEEIAQILGSDVISATSAKERRILLDMQSLLEKNTEALDFVKGYPNRAEYQKESIDLGKEFESGKVPLLMQWDRRWGYDPYGDSIIGLAGCGPTCLAMAYLYLTEDTAASPRTMAKFADENGYYTESGTSWALWTEGAERLGLSGTELPLDQGVMERTLDGGGLIVCSMRPGDFTTTGHFILLCGYDENGFFVRDPNRRSNSEKQWTYETLQGQIKNLWSLTK